MNLHSPEIAPKEFPMEIEHQIILNLGGTSAGLHVLGDYIFTAATGGIDSEEALENPYSPDLTIGDNFLRVSEYTENVIFDSHFEQRDRMGRSITFLARLLTDYPHGDRKSHLFLSNVFIKNTL
jgi:hypothetical protein